MNFDQAFSLLLRGMLYCSATILLILAVIAYRRTKDWGFSCWIFSSSGTLLESISLDFGSIFTYFGICAVFFTTVVVFTVGAVRVGWLFLHLFSIHPPAGSARAAQQTDA